MSKLQKIANKVAGLEALEKLVAWDFEVYPFSDIHFRINHRLDVWPSTKKYYDTHSHQKGEYDELEKFVRSYHWNKEKK